ncbi:MAG: hypothetical protein AAF438_04970 [Pseudomonadota bacterium]
MTEKDLSKLSDLRHIGESIKSAADVGMSNTDYWGAVAYLTDEIALLSNAQNTPEWSQHLPTDLGLSDAMDLLLPRIRGLAGVLFHSAPNDLSRSEIEATSMALIRSIDATRNLMDAWWNAKHKKEEAA